MSKDQKAEFNAAMRGPWLEPPRRKVEFAIEGDPAYRDYQYDIFLGGDPQYQSPQPKPDWNPQAPRVRDHRYWPSM